MSGASSTRILGKHILSSGWADLRWTGAMWSIRSFRILSAWHSKTGTRAGEQEHAFWCCIHVWSCVCVWTRILAGYMKFLGLLVKCSMAAIYWMYLIVFVRYVYVYVFIYTHVYSFSSPQLSNVDVYAVFFYVITQRITFLPSIVLGLFVIRGSDFLPVLWTNEWHLRFHDILPFLIASIPAWIGFLALLILKIKNIKTPGRPRFLELPPLPVGTWDERYESW